MPYLRLYSTSTGVNLSFAFFAIFLPLSKVQTSELCAILRTGPKRGPPRLRAPPSRSRAEDMACVIQSVIFGLPLEELGSHATVLPLDAIPPYDIAEDLAAAEKL